MCCHKKNFTIHKNNLIFYLLWLYNSSLDIRSIINGNYIPKWLEPLKRKRANGMRN